MEKNTPLRIKAIVCTGVALGGLTACKTEVKAGDTGIATNSMSLRTDVLSPRSDYCDINSGNRVKLVRHSYIDYDTYEEPVTLIENLTEGVECSGWTSDSNLSEDFEWDKK
ncbi:MAG TPA: hypothetical protein PLU63_03255 [Candidatus Woesebacteria bacterium]|nr:hypothetical protein [Candidatus Woesebacteria bacterium]